MKETLFIRLASQGTQVSWCLHGQQSGYSSVQQGLLDEALVHGAGRQIILIVPTSEVMLMSAEMPDRLAAGQAAKIQRAVPYILEERLAEDVETLHFAVGRRLADGQIPVAIVSRQRMEAWMTSLSSHGVVPSMIVADVQCLPITSDPVSVWSALIEGKQTTVRSGIHSGFTTETEMLGDFLSLANPPADLRLQIYPVGVSGDGKPAALAGVAFPMEYASPVHDGLEYLVRGFNEGQAINLLQGEYTTQPNYQRWLLPYRAALILLGVWFALGLVSQVLEYRHLRHELNSLNQVAESSFRAAFPQVTHIVDLPTQAQQQLALLQRAGGNVGFLNLLQGTSAVLSKNPTLKLQEIQFREGALSLGLDASDIQALDGLQQSFASQPGLALEVQSANAGAQGVQIRARVKARS